MMTKEKLTAGVHIVIEVLRAVKEVGELPLGPMYAQFMARGWDLETFESMVRCVCNTKLAERTPHHTLKWKGNP